MLKRTVSGDGNVATAASTDDVQYFGEIFMRRFGADHLTAYALMRLGITPEELMLIILLVQDGRLRLPAE